MKQKRREIDLNFRFEPNFSMLLMLLYLTAELQSELFFTEKKAITY